MGDEAEGSGSISGGGTGIVIKKVSGHVLVNGSFVDGLDCVWLGIIVNRG